MAELKIIKNELVPVYETDKGEKVVYGLELHEVLEVKSNYREWIARRFDDIEAVKNREYQAVEISTPSGQTKKNHIIKLNTAKEMAMLERNDKGKQVRRYFIKVEEEYKEIVQNGITHNVKQLTVTSRDIATMTTSKNLHVKVLANIRDCIAELEEMGFNAGEFFIPDSYIGANNQENPQYICTERGCEYYSGKLEPDKRKTFIEEFTDRFERMRNVLDGKPVKRLPKLICLADVEEKEPFIRLFQTDRGGIVLLDGEVYSLTPDEIEALSLFIPEMQKYNIGQIQYAVSAFLRSMKRSGKLEEIASWGLGNEAEQTKELPDKAVHRQKLQTDNSISLDNIENLTLLQAKTRYNIGRNILLKISDEAGARIKAGNKCLYSRQVLDDYFKRHAE